jgi:SAM-dependent MidA family methyltransferase
MQVDWTSIARRAEANGLRVAGFTDQHHFLTGIVSELGRGSPERSRGDWNQSWLPGSPKTKRALQTLLHPEMLGRAFQVLALAKNVDVSVSPLSGFKFAREARSALGL